MIPLQTRQPSHVELATTEVTRYYKETVIRIFRYNVSFEPQDCLVSEFVVRLRASFLEV